MFVGLAIVPLLVVGSVLTKHSFDAQAQQALVLQGEVARRVAAEVKAFIETIVSDLEVVAEVENIQKADAARQAQILADLLAHEDIYDAVTLLDRAGREKLRFSRLEVVSAGDMRDHSSENAFVIPQKTGQLYYSPIAFDQAGEPLITIAMPLISCAMVGWMVFYSSTPELKRYGISFGRSASTKAKVSTLSIISSG
jgi:hypothetical protein